MNEHETENQRRGQAGGRRGRLSEDCNEQETEKLDPGADGSLPARRESGALPEKELPPPIGGLGAGSSSVRERKPRRRRIKGVALGAMILSLVLALGLLALAVTASVSYLKEASGATADDRGAETDGQTEKVVFVRQLNDDSGILTTPELYGRCADTVVSILTKSKNASGVGSGFILSADGYIGTAEHVVAGMEELTVTLADGTEYPAVRVAGNELTDLALLKIDAHDLPTVTFGRAEELLIGERVVAIGTPASPEYAGSLCSGEVSYLGRTVRIRDESTGALEKKMTLIQTDAPVNPGNSGCPLFDEYGRVVGVVTMKLGSAYTGIGFASPAEGAEAILLAMMRGEPLTEPLLYAVSVPAPKLGIRGEARIVEGIYGIAVLDFSSETSSASAALRAGDLITAIDGHAVATAEELSEAINEKAPGDTVLVTVLRQGQALTFEIVLGT